VDVPEVTVNGDLVVHIRLEAGCWDVWGHGHGRLAAVIDDDGFGKASRARRWALVRGAEGVACPRRW
jgi:hypothetical protein